MTSHPGYFDLTLTSRHFRQHRSMSLINSRILRPLTRSTYKPFFTKSFEPRYSQPLRLLSTTQSYKMSTNNDDLQLSNLFDVKGKVALVTGGGTLALPFPVNGD